LSPLNHSSYSYADSLTPFATGITPLLKKKKRVTTQFVPSKSGVGGVLMIIGEDGFQQKSKWDDMVSWIYNYILMS
jgi:membrane-associated protease RseP (regulator of RpoE activity)